MGTQDRDNDSTAEFSAFVAERWDQAVRMTAQQIRNRHEAEDVVAEAMANLWRRWGQTEIANPWGYLRRSIQNEVIDRARKATRERTALQRLNIAGASVDVQPSDDHETLRLALAVLPQTSRQVLALRYLLDLSEQETARRLRIPVGTVKSHAFRGIRRVQEARRAELAAGAARPAPARLLTATAHH